MVDLIGTWWAVCLLLTLPFLANQVALVIAKRTRSAHDFAIEDDLPMTAGEWLRDRLVARPSLRAIVTDHRAKQSLDGYYYLHSVIQLTEETHFKADPSYWAIAAHELGHARVHLEHPGAAALIDGARIAKWVLATIVIGLGVGNLLYAVPGVTDFCFVLAVIAMGFHAGELASEASASLLAYAELRRSAHLTPRHLRAVRAVLWSSFGTYGITYAAHALLLTQWSHVERVTGRGRLGELAELTTFGWAIAALATIVAVLYALVLVLHIVRKLGDTEPPLFTFVGKLAIATLVYLAWDLRGDTTWAWWVMLATIPIAHVFIAVLALPLVPLRIFFAYLMKQVSGPGMHRSREWERARAAGSRIILEGNRTLASMLDSPAPSAGKWLRGVIYLAFVPLLIALWFG